MAIDHARDGLRINAVCPGDIDTPMLVSEAEDEGINLEDHLAQAAEDSPNGRIGTPEEVAALILFLASDAATHITGTAIPIDGGVSA
jgi:NAD(P)-dependent dehydrogenase (short-subunit alcohol dehydrogenase family)